MIAFKQLDDEQIGKRIKELRIKRGLSQTKVSDDTCIPQTTLSKFESGAKRLSSDNANALAIYYQTSLDYLFWGNCPGEFGDRVYQMKYELTEAAFCFAKNNVLRIDNTDGSFKIFTDDIPGFHQFIKNSIILQDSYFITKDQTAFEKGMNQQKEQFFSDCEIDKK